VAARYRLIAANELDDGLLQAWRDAQASDIAFASPYFCAGFTQAVARVRDDVRIVVIENDGQAVGFFPHQHAWHGMGRPVGGAFSDYHGVVVKPSADWDIKQLMRAAGLSVWVFDHLSGNADKFGPYVHANATSPQMDLSQGYASYLASRGDNVTEFNRKARKLGREVGAVTFTYHDADPEALEALIRWKSEQYIRTAGKDSVFTETWTGGLLRAIVQTQTDDFAGVCSSLRVDGKPIAVHMGMRSQQHLHYWFPAYDTALSKYSGGGILLLRMAEAAPEHGIQVIDLGKGDSRYKGSMMTGAAPLFEGAVELPSVLTTARQVRRMAEAQHAAGGLAAKLFDIPVRAARRMDRMRRFR
jgi:CelD/BcsL family acetyltransferase involved in cellulose biosynthesis